MRRLAALTLVLSTLLGSPSCTEKPLSPIVMPPADSTVSFARQVAPLFFRAGYDCRSCHGTPGNSNYSVVSYASVLRPGNQASFLGLLPVKAGDPDSSYLVWKLEGRPRWPIEGDRMPQGRGPMAGSDIALVRTWIRQGARDN